MSQKVSRTLTLLGTLGNSDTTPLLIVDEAFHYKGILDTHRALQLGLKGIVRECTSLIRPLTARTNLHTAAVEFAVCRDLCLPVVDSQSTPIGLLRRSGLPDSSGELMEDKSEVFVPLVTSMFEFLARAPKLIRGKDELP